MTEAELIELRDAWDDLLFGVRRSVRYHTYRRAFFDAAGNWTTFLTITTGGGVLVAGSSTADTSSIVKALGGITVFLGAVDLVLGFSLKARDHFDLAKQFIRLEQQMVKVGRVTSAEQLAEATSTRLEIEASEPPIFRTLDTYCHNELIDAMGGKDSDKRKIGPIRGALKQFIK